ncbi:MAG: hypothetical protein PHW10_01590 [Candidatus Peribacteraceae bacterium]|nr:hypothetical protein [Candidatus Peribacteraceae bacterium]
MNGLCRALYSFVSEIGRQRDLCIRHRFTTAIHTKSKELGVYRMYGREEEAIKYLRDAASSLPPWEEAALFDWEGVKWNKVKAQIDRRVGRHKELEPVVSRGVAWKGNPVAIHAYKFEVERFFKIELEMLGETARQPERALKTMAEALECHDFLIPEAVAKPKAPYTKHEAAFLTIDEYLSRKLPPDMYALYSLPQPADSKRAT